MEELLDKVRGQLTEKEMQITFNTVMKNPVVCKCLKELHEFDEYTYEHSVRVAGAAIEIGSKYFLNKEELVIVGSAGAMHDIGKIKVGRDIICKPEKLTESEYSRVQRHVLYSCVWLEEREVSKSIIRAVSEHHERKGGTGYPFGKQGKEISLYGRILAVADIYDAMRYKRVYNDRALSEEEAVSVLRDTQGVDSHVIDILDELI